MGPRYALLRIIPVTRNSLPVKEGPDSIASAAIGRHIDTWNNLLNCTTRASTKYEGYGART